jgi:hypothetical protein
VASYSRASASTAGSSMIREKQITKLLSALSEGMDVRAACKEAKMGRATYYRLRKSRDGFADRVDAVRDIMEKPKNPVTKTMPTFKHEVRDEILVAAVVVLALLVALFVFYPPRCYVETTKTLTFPVPAKAI